MTSAAIKISKNWFEQGGEAYASFRPNYPPELPGILAAFASSDATALDVGCGNGQLTAQLASDFQAVVGVDSSASQVANAATCRGVRYICAAAERLPLREHSVNLITAAQAAHWFDLDAFYAEARRVLAPRGVLSLITYGVVEVDGESGRIIEHFRSETIRSFWPPERRHVETGYRALPFPFAEATPPLLTMTFAWSLAELLGYVGTWSALRNAEIAFGRRPLERFAADLGDAWGDPERRREVRWPLSLRIGHV